MPPKKDAKKDAKKGGDSDENDMATIAKAFELQNEALQRQLAERTERALAAERVAHELRARMRSMEGDMVSHEKNTFDITAEMSRQYKAMQESLQTKISGLEGEIHRLRDDLTVAKAQLVETARDKDAIIARRDEEIERLKSKMEDMASEFGDMLAETLRKMGERVELSSAAWEGEGSGGPLVRRMEEMARQGGGGGPGAGNAGAGAPA